MTTEKLLVVFIVLMGVIYDVQSQRMRKASQCFKSLGIPKVGFDCPDGHMIKISRAFHGIATMDRSQLSDEDYHSCIPSPGHSHNNCTMCEGDCIDDSMNLVYDWSTCMGNVSCIRTVMQSYMPSCPGHDKFSDYLQVEYQCIPRKDVLDVCSHLETSMKSGYIMSPNYPYNYPVNQNCICRLSTDWGSKVVLSLYDLLLETKNGRCRADWLMLRQKEQKHRHCGAIMTGTKNLTSERNSIEIQFHSDKNDNRTQNFQYFTRSLKGFWLHFDAKPSGLVKVSCRKLSKSDKEVQEINRDDKEFEEVMTSGKENEIDAKDMTTAKTPPKGNGNLQDMNSIEKPNNNDAKNKVKRPMTPKNGSNQKSLEGSHKHGVMNSGPENSSSMYLVSGLSLFFVIEACLEYLALLLY